MRRLLSTLLLLTSAYAANGSFSGLVVNGPNLDADKKWVFIQGARGPVRRVDVSATRVAFGEAVKQKDKDAKPEDAIRKGAEVRITASQDGDGEWIASKVEIVKSAPK